VQDLCSEAFALLKGRVTVIASAWHSRYHSVKPFVEWYRAVKPPKDVVVCLYLLLQCFPSDYPVYSYTSLQRITEVIADALPPCAVAGFLLRERVGGRLVDRLPDRGVVVDFASGIGGWALGLYQALQATGRTAEYTVYAYDVDPERLNIYKRGVEKYTGWRVVAIQADLKRELPDVAPDVAVGSPPCEDLSPANQSRDVERGLVLVRRYLDYVDYVRPRVALFEEVATLRRVRSAIEDVLRRRGWIREVRCLSDYGAPQKCRRRILAYRTV